MIEKGYHLFLITNTDTINLLEHQHIRKNYCTGSVKWQKAK